VQILTRQLEADIVRYRIEGMTFDWIGTQLDMSTSGVHEAFWRCINRNGVANVRHLRAEALVRLDAIRARGWILANRPKPVVSALHLLLACEERQARLFGLDEANRFDGMSPIAPSVTEQAEKIAKHLTVDQQRELVFLLRLARGWPFA
jgi:hypothetical protein